MKTVDGCLVMYLVIQILRFGNEFNIVFESTAHPKALPRLTIGVHVFLPCQYVPSQGPESLSLCGGVWEMSCRFPVKLNGKKKDYSENSDLILRDQDILLFCDYLPVIF